MRAFPKPCEIEQVVTLNPRQRAIKRRELYDAQFGSCGCGCGQRMTWDTGQMSSCTLEHEVIRSAGCKKNDADWNISRVFRWDHNSLKGSRRPEKPRPQVMVIQ